MQHCRRSRLTNEHFDLKNAFTKQYCAECEDHPSLYFISSQNNIKYKDIYIHTALE